MSVCGGYSRIFKAIQGIERLLNYAPAASIANRPVTVDAVEDWWKICA